MDNSLYIQAQKFFLAGNGVSSTDTSMVLRSFKLPNGTTTITTTDIGSIGYGTIDAGTAREEIISFTTVTQNADGTATLSGITRGLGFIAPYTTVAANRKTHGGGSAFILTNNPQLYDKFAAKANDETITQTWTFSAFLPRSGAGNATDGTELITYAQALALATGTANINRVVVAGNAGETVTAGQLLYLLVTDGEWYKADADTAAQVDNIILGIAQGAGTDGNTITSGVLLFGLDSNQTGLTTNTAYYAGNTAGVISSTPGTVEVSVGISRSTTSLLFYPRYNQQLTEDQQDALVGTSGTPSTSNKFVTANDESRNYRTIAYAASVAGTDTYAITLSPVPTAYTTGMSINFKADVANTGAATINVNGLGAKTIKQLGGTALTDGMIAANSINQIVYDGTDFILQTAATSASTPVFLRIPSPQQTLIATGVGQIAVGYDQSQANPTYWWVATADGSTVIKIYRLDRQTSGNYLYTGISVTVSPSANATILGVTEMGGKVYAKYLDNATVKVVQHTTLLANPAQISGFGTANLVGLCSDPDGVHVWSTVNAATQVTKYSISGTTATAVTNLTFSPAIPGGNSSPFIFNGTKFYSNEVNVVSPQTVRTWDSAGANSTTQSYALFYFLSTFEIGCGFLKSGNVYYSASAQKLDATNIWHIQCQEFNLF